MLCVSKRIGYKNIKKNKGVGFGDIKIGIKIQYVWQHRAPHETIHITHSQCVNTGQCGQSSRKGNTSM
jgi:hypothetical protein